MDEQKRRWTDPVGSAVTARRIVVEERPERYGSLYAIYVEAEGKRLVADELTFDEAIACVALVIGNGRAGPFLRTTEEQAKHVAWVRGIDRRRVIEPWERFLPELATQPEEMARG